MMLWILVESIGVFPFLADSPRTFPWRGIGLGLDPFNRGYTAWVLGISIETATELGMGAMVERMRTSVFPPSADTRKTFRLWGTGPAAEPQKSGFTGGEPGISIETATELGMGAMVERMRTSVFPPSADTRKTFRLWETGPAAEPQKSGFTGGEPGISTKTATEYGTDVPWISVIPALAESPKIFRLPGIGTAPALSGLGSIAKVNGIWIGTEMASGMAAYGTPAFLPLADSPMISPSLENGNPDSPEPGCRGQPGGNRPAPVD